MGFLYQRLRQVTGWGGGSQQVVGRKASMHRAIPGPKLFTCALSPQRKLLDKDYIRNAFLKQLSDMLALIKPAVPYQVLEATSQARACDLNTMEVMTAWKDLAP